MAKYKDHSSSQGLFIPVNLEEQLVPGTFEHAMNYIIDNIIDLSIFDSRFCNDETGAPAYSPTVLLKIVLYAYSLGIIHSRKIAKCCEDNVTFIALSGNSTPHFTTIANFVSSLDNEISTIFVEVLLICDSQNLIGKNMFAIDGCKLSSNCSKEWSGTRSDFEKKKSKIEKSIKFILDKHALKDQEEKLTSEIIEKEKKAIKNLQKKAAKIQKWLDDNEDKQGASGKIIQSNITDNESAKMISSRGTIQGYNGVAIADDKNQIIVSAEAFGTGAEQSLLKPMIDLTKSNFRTAEICEDVFEENVLTADSGFHSEQNMKMLSDEGIDAYVADNHFRKRDPLFETAQRHKKKRTRSQSQGKKYFEPSDFRYDCKKNKLICPAGNELSVKSSSYKNKKKKVKGTLYAAKKTDCRKCPLRDKCLRKENTEHRHVAILSSSRDSYTGKMIEKFDSLKGRHMYSRRMGTVEPVFANIRNMIGLDRFTLRGKKKVSTQWKLYCIVHNIGKIARYCDYAVGF